METITLAYWITAGLAIIIVAYLVMRTNKKPIEVKEPQEQN